MRDLKSDHLKSGLFENPIVNGLAIAIVPTILKPKHSKSRHFFHILNGLRKNGRHLSGSQMIRLPDFRSHLKFGPFVNQHLFNHLTQSMSKAQ